MINMTPPAFVASKKEKLLKPKLITRNTHVEITVDPEDYDVAKHIFWYEEKGEYLNEKANIREEGRIVNEQGVDLKTYLGIKGQKKRITAWYDFRRSNYTTG